MRPFSFTKNIGGFVQAYEAIRRGYSPGVTIKEFRDRCGLINQELVLTEYLIGGEVRDGVGYVLADSIIEQTLVQPYNRMLARLYFFSVNLNMPGQRVESASAEWGEMQNTLTRERLYLDDGLSVVRFDKQFIQDSVAHYYDFQPAALRKWVTNYYFMAEQCGFVSKPDGKLETFPDTWGPLALKLFFERYMAVSPGADAESLVESALAKELHKLIGVPKNWLDTRIEGAAEAFLARETSLFAGDTETEPERKSAEKGLAPPPQGEEARRRESRSNQLIRRGDNKRFLRQLYGGECQISGVKLAGRDGTPIFDCAHIRPLGIPHRGPDDVGNMLSLSPTMHRLFDRRCIQIDPKSLKIRVLHGNMVPHLPKLLVRGNHVVDRANLEYFLSRILRS